MDPDTLSSLLFTLVVADPEQSAQSLLARNLNDRLVGMNKPEASQHCLFLPCGGETIPSGEWLDSIDTQRSKTLH
jgi:hypothetical protein